MIYFVRKEDLGEDETQDISIFSKQAIMDYEVDFDPDEEIVEVRFGNTFKVREEERVIEKVVSKRKK